MCDRAQEACQQVHIRLQAADGARLGAAPAVTMRDMSDVSLHLRITATNAARFRRVNDCVAAEARAAGAAPGRRWHFLCECPISECTIALEIELGEYLRIRSNPTWFVIMPHHDLPLGDRVVERRAGFWIIEKEGEARRVAEAEAGRRGPVGEIEEARGLLRAVNAARWQEREYQHALDHYVALMRHRLANPLTAIIGLTQALVDMPDLDDDTRARVAAAIQQQCRQMLDVSLDPRVISSEESVLAPAPFQQVDGADAG